VGLGKSSILKIYQRTEEGKQALLGVSLDDPWMRHCLRLVDGKRDVPTLLKMLPADAGEALIDKLERLGLIQAEQGTKMARTIPPALRTSGLAPIELQPGIDVPPVAVNSVKEVRAQIEQRMSTTTTQMQALLDSGLKLNKTGANAAIKFQDSDVDLFKIAGMARPGTNTSRNASVAAAPTSNPAFEKTAPLTPISSLETTAPLSTLPDNKPADRTPVKPTPAVGESTMMIRALNANPFETAKLAIMQAAQSAMQAARLGEADELQQTLAGATSVEQLSRGARDVYTALKTSSLFEAANFDTLQRAQLATLRK
jgi:hypothetical protein